MNSLLQSSLYGHDFVKYRKNHSQIERERFSHNVRTKGIGELPIVIDSVDTILSEALAGPDSTRFNRNGKEFHFHTDLLIEDILLEIKHRIKADDTKLFKLGLENGKILDNKDILGDIYKKHKNQKDNILYLLLTQENTMYGYIMSLLRFIFGPNFMKK
jgi:hypothetical protein